MNKNHSLLLKLANTTLVLVYLVILAGAVVRATGSGMGCPDWPKCFGKLIPPTDSLSLPHDYRQVYVEKRKAKNERMAKLLRFFGASDLADKIVNDPSINSELDFNVAKAWIEYANRLCGVLLGFAQVILVFFAWKFRKEVRRLLLFSFLALLLTIFEGWLGSIVVSTNLLPGTITLHMLLALGIIIFMTAIIVKIRKGNVQTKFKMSSLVNVILLVAIFISLAQIILGTQVREQVDSIASRFDDRSLWMDQLSVNFYVHRSLAILVLLLNGFLFLNLRNASAELKRFSNYLLGVIVLEIIAGVVLNRFSIPRYIQPFHLMFAVLMFGFQMSIYYRIKKASVS